MGRNTPEVDREVHAYRSDHRSLTLSRHECRKRPARGTEAPLTCLCVIVRVSRGSAHSSSNIWSPSINAAAAPIPPTIMVPKTVTMFASDHADVTMMLPMLLALTILKLGNQRRKRLGRRKQPKKQRRRMLKLTQKMMRQLNQD